MRCLNIVGTDLHGGDPELGRRLGRNWWASAGSQPYSTRRLPTWRQTRLHERRLNSSLACSICSTGSAAMRAWVIFSTDAGSAVTAQIASDLLEPTITARPRTDRLKHRPLEKSWRCRAARLRFGAKLLKSLALPRGLEPPVFAVRGRGSGPSKYSGEVNHSGVAPIEGSCSAIGLHLLIEPVTRPLASWNVVTLLLSVRAVPVTRPARS